MEKRKLQDLGSTVRQRKQQVCVDSGAFSETAPLGAQHRKLLRKDEGKERVEEKARTDASNDQTKFSILTLIFLDV